MAANRHELRSSYLLDNRYDSGLSDVDRELRDALIRFADSATPAAKDSGAWPHIAQLFTRLGMDPHSNGPGQCS